MSIETDLADLQRKLTEQQRREAQAEFARDSAKEKLTEAVATLKSEFGVATVDEAVALLNKLETELSEGIEEVQNLLED